MKLRLFNYWRSSASHRVRIALGLKELPWEYVPVSLAGEQRGAAHLERNPMGQVPTLEITEDDGSVRYLTQSVAILEYLEERVPSPMLLPADPYLRARTRALVEIVNAGIQPLQNLSTTKKIKELGGDDRAFVQGFIASGLAAFARLVEDTSGRFCVGDTPTLADCCLVPQLHSARRFEVPFDHLGALARIEAACNALPAFVAAEPLRQPDAQP